MVQYDAASSSHEDRQTMQWLNGKGQKDKQ
jgi:hypothetical protein